MQERKMSQNIGMITIGQSPRNDIISDMRSILGSDISIIECGALDGLSPKEITTLQPPTKENLLVTRLREGTEVTVNKAEIVTRLNECITKLEAKTKVIVLLCTGKFEELQSKKPMLEPFLLLRNLLEIMLPTNSKLGMVIPSAEQAERMRDVWKLKGVKKMIIEAYSPYKGEGEKLTEKVKKFKKNGVDMIVLNCMGYSKEMREKVKKITNLPVILPRTLIARIVKDIL
ncbi:MAG: AroM family protein [Candidatus Korarchaeota archaeon]|nr:AroM family protein [Candidatus Korarchaeota archaeon]NIU82095.1 hypothetical protein [Candidatus Thorarchaeota archaeon]NIW12506.1 hypothetical protein [Candidatus Thorarchaeota archaeon]NIW50725.1 hypothetical protein [Candidatus Korarchaeota archaeon]